MQADDFTNTFTKLRGMDDLITIVVAILFYHYYIAECLVSVQLNEA